MCTDRFHNCYRTVLPVEWECLLCFFLSLSHHCMPGRDGRVGGSWGGEKMVPSSADPEKLCPYLDMMNFEPEVYWQVANCCCSLQVEGI